MLRIARRPGSNATLLGLLLFIVAAWLFLWAASSASARCAACECRYELTAPNAACRLPAFLAVIFLGAISAAAASFALARFQHKRAAKKADAGSSGARPLKMTNDERASNDAD